MLLTFPLNIVLATLPMAVSKYPMRANWGVKEYLGVQFEHSGRDVRQLASRVTLSAVRKERGVNAAVPPASPPFIQYGHQPIGWYHIYQAGSSNLW